MNYKQFVKEIETTLREIKCYTSDPEIELAEVHPTDIHLKSVLDIVVKAIETATPPEA